jgi:hypothetical protein
VKTADWSELPDEVRAMIVGEFADASPEWLPEFRQIDAQTRTLTDIHFGEFFFGNLVTFNSTFAAKEFKDICESPAIGPGIRKIVLSALRIQLDGAGRRTERLPVIESRDVHTGVDSTRSRSLPFWSRYSWYQGLLLPKINNAVYVAIMIGFRRVRSVRQEEMVYESQVSRDIMSMITTYGQV